MKTILATLLLAAAMLSMFLAAVVAMRRTDIARRFLMGTFIALVLYALVLFLPGGPRRLDLDELDRRCATVRLAVEQHRARHGAYPAAIEEVGVSIPRTPYGPLRYAAGSDGGAAYYRLYVAASPEATPIAVWDSRRPDDGWTAAAGE